MPNLALVSIEQVESEDHPSTRITSVEPTVIVYQVGEGVSVEVKTFKDVFHEETRTVFDSEKPLGAKEIYALMSKLGFSNVELISSGE